jgi:hypothetical protein
MPRLPYITVADVLTHLQDFAGSNLKASQLRQRRKAISLGYQHLTTLQPWRYYIKQDRISVAAPYTTGTISYDHTGGAAERLVTLNGGTFPSWTGRGTLVPASGAEYEISERLTDTTATLTETSNPGSDFSSTAYTLYNDKHLLPLDALSIDQLYGASDKKELTWTDPKDFLQQRQKGKKTDRPGFYTLLGDVDAMGRMMIRLAPFPVAALEIDYTYARNARPLLFDSYTAGTVTTAATTAVTGASTSWVAAMVGSVLRVGYASADVAEDLADTAPQWFESMAMPYPWLYEQRVTDVDSATALTVDAAIPALSGVRYEISDPIDIEQGAMMTAFMRCCEWQLGCLMRWQDRKELGDEYERALMAAIQVDKNYNLRSRIEPTPVAEIERRENMPTNLGGR